MGLPLWEDGKGELRPAIATGEKDAARVADDLLSQGHGPSAAALTTLEKRLVIHATATSWEPRRFLSVFTRPTNWEDPMATSKPKDNARKGAVKKRTQLKTKVKGEETWTKRSKSSGKFMDQRKTPAKKKFKGVRREKAA
jgi:hypothetical protein